MKYFYLLLLCLIIGSNIQAQPYLPIGFDTTCYWIYSWQSYAGGSSDCYGHRISIITKDTLINNTIYWKVENCPISPMTGAGNFCIPSYYSTHIAYIREDTISKQIYRYSSTGEFVILDFNLAINDTFNIGLGAYNPKVDSITKEQLHTGDSSIVHHGMFGLGNHYKAIQRVGANYNFIFSGYGEWFTPAYTLECFSKNKQVIYLSKFAYDTLKKPCYSIVSINDVTANPMHLQYRNHQILFNNNENIHGELLMLDMLGKCIFSKPFNNKNVIINTPNLAAGIYLLKINIGTNFYTEKIRIA